jgi:hypothetical protein
MVAATVAATRHRKGVLPGGHVGPQLGRGLGKLGLESLLQCVIPMRDL